MGRLFIFDGASELPTVSRMSMASEYGGAFDLCKGLKVLVYISSEGKIVVFDYVEKKIKDCFEGFKSADALVGLKVREGKKLVYLISKRGSLDLISLLPGNERVVSFSDILYFVSNFIRESESYFIY